MHAHKSCERTGCKPFWSLVTRTDGLSILQCLMLSADILRPMAGSGHSRVLAREMMSPWCMDPEGESEVLHFGIRVGRVVCGEKLILKRDVT